MNHLKSNVNGVSDSPYNKTVEAVTAARSLSKDDNGKVLLLSGAGVQIDLPAVADIEAGWNVKAIVNGAVTTANFTVVSATNVIQGFAIVNGASVAAVNENTISFVQAPADPGDNIEIIFDGTNFLVFGAGVAAGSITFTAP